MKTVLVLGQTPPPYHGQAIAIGYMVKGSYTDVEILYDRMNFSADILDVGTFRVRKVFHLLAIIMKAIRVRLSRRVDILYYPPAGPDRVPMWRDIAILLVLRPLFPKTIFHFHASGLSTLFDRLTPVERFFFKAAYLRPSAGIRTSEYAAPDPAALRAEREFIIPYGIPDHSPLFFSERTSNGVAPTLLWVGALHEAKGIGVLLEACGLLRDRDLRFRLTIVGEYPSTSWERDLRERISALGIQRQIRFVGPLTGDEKWKAYADANIFCLPSYYEREAMPLVVIEAMQFSLPVVATRWRGIPSMVQDGYSGLLVPVRDSGAVADALEILIRDPDRAKLFGQRGREEYLKRFTIETYLKNLNTVFLTV